jgi:hypothetical protein
MPVGTTPAGWNQWSSDPATSFSVSSARALSGSNGVATSAGSAAAIAQAYLATGQPSDVQVSVADYLSNLTPAQVFARGSALGIASPTFYAAQVSRGMSVQLVKVVNGTPTVLQTVTSTVSLSNQWVLETLSLAGNHLQVQVFRTDTGQYLASNGQWQSTPVWAIDTTDGSIQSGSTVGIGRPSGAAEALYFDDFSVIQASAAQSFDGLPVGSAPPGWSQWSSDPSTSFNVSSATALSAPGSLTTTVGTSRAVAQAYLNASEPADVQVAAADFLTNLTPAQVFARGSGLGTASPTFYAAQVSRGMTVQLVRVVNGISTVLQAVNSASYMDNRWVEVTLSTSGSHMQIQVFRPDTNQYLASTGKWQTAQAWVIDTTDTSIVSGNTVGIGRTSGYAESFAFDDFAVSAPASSAPPPSPPASSTQETFESTAVGQLPNGWQSYSNNPSQTVFTVGTGKPESGSHDLQITSLTLGDVARAWNATVQPADIQVSAAVFVNNLTHAQIIARGSNLNTTTPTYYAAEVWSQGGTALTVQLVKVIGGVTTAIGNPVTAPDYFNGRWVQITLDVEGSQLRVQLERLDPPPSRYPYEYLNQLPGDQAGLAPLVYWQTAPTWVLSQTDTSITGGGLAGLGRPASAYKDTLYFDDFSATPPPGDTTPPALSNLIISPSSTPITGTVTVSVNATDNVHVIRVEFYVDNNLMQTLYPTIPYQPSTAFTWTGFNTSTVSNGTHTLTVKAYDIAGNVGQASLRFTTQNANASPPLTFPQKYPWIRISEFAYNGWPLDSTAQSLLSSHAIDLIVSDTFNQSAIATLSPNTPELVYTNLSNIYQNLLTNWLHYADTHGLDREGAFLHVNTPTPYSAYSLSTQPVTWFWSAYQYLNSTQKYTDVTAIAHQTPISSTSKVAFGSNPGDAVLLGYPDRFDQINVNLSSKSGSGAAWPFVVEYPSAVDASGNVTAWSPLTVTDGTAGLTKSGTISFLPPTNWQAAVVPGFQINTETTWLYYVRIRTLSGASGTAPTAYTLLGRDYTGAGSTGKGTIPVWQASLDTNHDGYISDAELQAGAIPTTQWASYARFQYQSRALYSLSQYGEMRFATNSTNTGFQNWAIAYYPQLLAGTGGVKGLFVDNMDGSTVAYAGHVQETLTNYAADYGAILNGIEQQAPNTLVIANVGNLIETSVDPLIQQIDGYFAEFALQAVGSNWGQFEDLANQVAHRTGLTTPSPYTILDALDGGNGANETDPRTLLSTLAEYYLITMNPATTFLDFWGGQNPTESWSKHWTNAVSYNIGQSAGSLSLAAWGVDPENSSLTYHVYQRSFLNGTTPTLVLYKPVSYNPSTGGRGTTDNGTATVYQLNGTYRVLQADGTLSSTTVTSVSLRNGEGMVLVKQG